MCARNEDVALWTDAQLVLWMKDHLSRYLRQLRSLTGAGAQRRFEQAAQEIRRLQADNARLRQQVQAEAKRAATYQATIADQRQQIEGLQRELADSRADLDTARRRTARSAAQVPPVISDLPVVEEPFVLPQPKRPSSSTSTADWYAAWQHDTAPEVLARQQRLIQLVGDGEAFIVDDLGSAFGYVLARYQAPRRPLPRTDRWYLYLARPGASRWPSWFERRVRQTGLLRRFTDRLPSKTRSDSTHEKPQNTGE